MANLNIYVSAENNQTVSKFGVTKNDHVYFNNKDASNDLTIKVPPPSPICIGGRPTEMLQVLAGNSVKVKVCGAGEFKYEATIAGSGTEDPIVIIEPSMAFGAVLFSLGPAAVVGMLGLVVGGLIGKRMARNRPKTAA